MCVWSVLCLCKMVKHDNFLVYLNVCQLAPLSAGKCPAMGMRLKGVCADTDILKDSREHWNQDAKLSIFSRPEVDVMQQEPSHKLGLIFSRMDPG